MPTLYVASTGTFVGKSAVCMGLLKRMQRDGFSVGYMKPVSVSAIRTSDAVVDEDAALIRTLLASDIPPEQMVPVAITPSLIDGVLQGQTASYEQILRNAYDAVAQNKEVLVLEGSNNWAEGALVDLTSDRVIDILDAKGLLVTRYHSMQTVDAILTVQRYIGEHLLGVLINQIELPHMEDVQNRIEPFLESRGIPVFGLLPQDRLLASVPIEDLVEHLGGRLIGQPEWCDKTVEALMVGSMGSEQALSFLRRKANKAVVVGGDRIEFQLVSLETSTNLLILTGNIQPSLRVIDRAEERQVPILVVPDDTLSTVERAEQLFGRVRFHQPAKLQRFTDLLDQHFDFDRLYAALELKNKS
jgi:hypothetical protein